MKIFNNIYWVGSGAVGLSDVGDCHTYVIEGSDCFALVDCGMSKNPKKIIENMQSDGLDLRKLRYVLLTHAHPDHAGSCKYMKTFYDVKIVCSEYEGQVLQQGPMNFFKLQGDHSGLDKWKNMNQCDIDITVGNQDIIDIGGIKVEVIKTPGHTAGSLCYFVTINGKNMLFSGDTVFYKGFISVLGPPFSDIGMYRKGMMNLSGKNIDGLFPGHLMWTLSGGQKYVDTVIQAFQEYRLPMRKPFS